MAQGRPAPGGRGSVDPTFTPSVAVVQPGFQTRAPETPLQQLERVLFSAGSLGAQALQTAASAKRRRDNMREKAVARQDALMGQVQQTQATARHSMQQVRLEEAQKKQADFLIRSEAHDPVWLVRQARLQMVNAPSEEERSIWTDFFQDAHAAAQKIELTEQKKRQVEIVNQFSLAGQTADNAIAALGDRLKLDSELQSQLIGDGTNIHDRVQDWALEEAERVAPEVFDIDAKDEDRELREEQRDALVVQLIRSTLPIADRLIEQHRRNMEQSASATGVSLVSSQLSAYFKGDIGIDAMAESMSDTGELHFNHLSSTQKTEKAKQILTTAMDAALKGRFGFDISRIEPRMEALIERGPFSTFEKDELRGAVQEGMTQLAVTHYNALVTRKRLSFTMEVPVPTADGVPGMRSVARPNALVSMAQVGSDGRSEFDRIATQAIIDSGLDQAPEDMTPIQLAGVARILDTAADFNAQGQVALAKNAAEIHNLELVSQGDPAGDPAKAYEVGAARRVFSSERMLGPNQIQQIMDVEALIRAERPELRGTPEAEQLWDPTQPLERTPETRSIREAVWALEANEWSREEVAKAFALPENLTAEMSTMWQQGGTEEMIDVLFFASNLTDIRREELFSAMGDGSSESLALRNAYHEWWKGANNITFRPSLEDLMADSRSAMKTAKPAEFLASATSFQDQAGSLSRDVAAAAMAEILTVKRMSVKPGDFSFGNLQNAVKRMFVSPSEDFNENMSFIQSAFMGPTKPIVDRMMEVWAMRVQTTDDTPVEAANFVFEVMKADGFHFQNLDGETTIVQDPQFHFGPDDPSGVDLQVNVLKYIEQPLAEWQKSVLIQALDIRPPAAPPTTIAELYQSVPTLVNPERIRDSRGNKLPLEFTISEGTNGDAQATLRAGELDWGGVILQARDPSNPQRLFPVIRARKNVTYTGPDGQEHVIVAGQPLSVFSFHLLETELETENRLRREAFIESLDPAGRAAFTSSLDIPGMAEGNVPLDVGTR